MFADPLLTSLSDGAARVSDPHDGRHQRAVRRDPAQPGSARHHRAENVKRRAHQTAGGESAGKTRSNSG